MRKSSLINKNFVKNFPIFNLLPIKKSLRRIKNLFIHKKELSYIYNCKLLFIPCTLRNGHNFLNILIFRKSQL